MKLNDLAGLLSVAGSFSTSGLASLLDHTPRGYGADTVDHRNGNVVGVAEAGCVPILHMRELQRSGKLGEALLRDVGGQ